MGKNALTQNATAVLSRRYAPDSRSFDEAGSPLFACEMGTRPLGTRSPASYVRYGFPPYGSPCIRSASRHSLAGLVIGSFRRAILRYHFLVANLLNHLCAHFSRLCDCRASGIDLQIRINIPE